VVQISTHNAQPIHICSLISGSIATGIVIQVIIQA
jgi:hypothetical protein